MNASRRLRLLSLLLGAWMCFLPVRSIAEDIDIFVGASAGASQNPNVLIILDNTSNWSQQAQQWPDGATQGQSELQAILSLIPGLGSNVNVGLMMFTDSGAGRSGGYIRYAVRPMTDANKAAFAGVVQTAYNNFGQPSEKTSSSANYGAVMFDAFKYFGGFTSPEHASDGVAGTPQDATHFGPTVYNTRTDAALADRGGYTNAALTHYESPIGADGSCAKNYIIFIGNGFPNTDLATGSATCSSSDSAQDNCLTGLQGDIAQIKEPRLTTQCASNTFRFMVTQSAVSGPRVINANASNTCYASLADCNTGECTAGRANCTCGGAITACAGANAGKSKYQFVSYDPATTANLGYTAACYANAASAVTTDYTCAPGATCRINAAQTTTALGAFKPDGTYIYPSPPLSSNQTPYSARMADEWARFLFLTDVSSVTPTASPSASNQQYVTTYTIDVFNAQQSADQTALLRSMASAGGGKYFEAKRQSSILNALKEILAEIQSVNSTFASASLPVNATNRTQNANQVFIGMFRPDPAAGPRWFGNLKQYQIGRPDGVTLDLVDVDGRAATNPQTGFLSDCAASFWTSDSPTPAAWNNNYYWKDVVVSPPPEGRCPTTPFNRFSDKPDGSFVEKGAVAEVLRKGNNPPYADGDSAAPTWTTASRNLYTLNGGALVAFNRANVTASLSDNALNFTQGKDVMNDSRQGGANTSIARPSIHGDVIHSRPMPVNYGSGVTVYYGSNDGTFRAVDSTNGKELWAFIAPEFALASASRSPTGSTDPLTRLMNNSPLVDYPNVDDSLQPLPKDYFFDGSTGVYQNLNNTKVWLYPTMRRGGRMIYAFDVSGNAAPPTFKWRRGCPNLTTDAGCDAGFSGIGQTWSTPNVAFVKGYATAAPVLFVGGGYDNCEDANQAAPACGGAKGAAIYVINADTGALIASFPTARSVAADVAAVDIDEDGYVDYAYAADTGGNIYRIDLVQRSVSGTTATYAPLASANWSIHRVAHTNGAGRKFLFSPSLFPLAAAGKVFVAVGSGDREHPLASEYPYASVTNRFYVYLDNLAATAANNMDDTALFEDMTNSSVSDALVAANGGSCMANVFTNGKIGWFMDLAQYGRGEQTVSSSVIAGGTVSFNTNRPIPPVAGTCSQMLGEARGYRVNLFNAGGAINCSEAGCTCGGQRSGIFAGGGLPPSPVMGTLPVNGTPTTVCIGCIPDKCVGANCGTPFTPSQIKPSISPIRKKVYQYTTGAD